MKPGDHPDFFRFAPPPGASRQSTIVLDKDGKFWHDGVQVEHRSLELALHRWIAVHPDDGRFILTNGYDWCYFEVQDAPFTVQSLKVTPDGATLVLSDQTDEALDPTTLRVASDEVVYCLVKGGKHSARFSRHAQTQLAPLLTEDSPPRLRLLGKTYAFAPVVGSPDPS